MEVNEEDYIIFILLTPVHLHQWWSIKMMKM